MSKIKISGNASGTGVVTLTAPNTNTDRTITLPDGTATLATKENFTSTGIDDNATSTAITLNSSGSVNFNGLIGQMTGAYCYLRFRDDGIADTITIDSRKLVASGKGNIRFTTTDSVGNSSERLKIMGDGRGLSQFTAKAWVNFNGTGTVAIRDSHNVSSITDTGTGSYTINFSNNLGNTSYSAVSVNSDTEANGASLSPAVFNVGSLSVSSRNGSGTLMDGSKLNATVFGD